MALRKSGSTVAKTQAPLEAEVTETYGLYVGPEGGALQKKGFQAKHPKWEFIFSADGEGTPMLMNILDYLFQESSDYVAVEKGVEAFIAAYLAKKGR